MFAITLERLIVASLIAAAAFVFATSVVEPIGESLVNPLAAVLEGSAKK